MESRSRLLSYALVFLVGACAAVQVLERVADRRRRSATESFQKLVGGLGFGPALDLSDCAFGFDPRLDGSCSASVGPLPGAGCFCGRHGGLFSYLPPRPGGAGGVRGGGHPIPPRD